MTLRYYSSADGSAPVLTGQNDALCALLHACLVTGYGAQTAAGWTRQYDAANKSVFQMAAAGGRLQASFRVLDDGSLATVAAREAVIRGYESMSDVDTGVDPFPLTSQRTDVNCVIRKSSTADATARPWKMVATERFFILCVEFQTAVWGKTFFGELDYSDTYESDNYCVVCAPRAVGNSSAFNDAFSNGISSSAGTGSAAGLYLARNRGGTVKSSVGYIKTFQPNYGLNGADLSEYPDPSDNKLRIFPTIILDNQNTGIASAQNRQPRAILPYVFEPFWETTPPGVAAGDIAGASGYSATASFVLVHPSTYACWLQTAE